MSVVLIISAPSGSGKSTLARRLIETDSHLDFSTSVTTRQPRRGDEEGKSYRFVSEVDFLAMRDRNELLEWARVFGNYYGTSKDVLDSARQRGHDLLLDIDVQGAASLMKRLPEAVTVFILPPSPGELENRLRNRSSDSNEVIEYRLREAAQEVANYGDYNYVLINDQIDETAEQLRSILVAERCRQQRMAGRTETVDQLRSIRIAERCRQRRMAERIEPIVESFQAGTRI
ncbi:MAG: guanylate kinase [Bryobacterales bacterium]|nr:guanylate kinase [Bryobacterales bacterium]MDE0295812.1 guanylate kinase [Bryobacterales bacterium]MDE0435642.1 guanylate kinase [Bryobacterales bacterium]